MYVLWTIEVSKSIEYIVTSFSFSTAEMNKYVIVLHGFFKSLSLFLLFITKTKRDTFYIPRYTTLFQHSCHPTHITIYNLWSYFFQVLLCYALCKKLSTWPFEPVNGASRHCTLLLLSRWSTWLLNSFRTPYEDTPKESHPLKIIIKLLYDVIARSRN